MYGPNFVLHMVLKELNWEIQFCSTIGNRIVQGLQSISSKYPACGLFPPHSERHHILTLKTSPTSRPLPLKKQFIRHTAGLRQRRLQKQWILYILYRTRDPLLQTPFGKPRDTAPFPCLTKNVVLCTRQGVILLLLRARVRSI